MQLEPAQERLLMEMVEAARKAPRHEQKWHLGGEDVPDDLLVGPWGERRVLISDVGALTRAGLLQAVHLNYLYGNDYVITGQGYATYAELKERAGAPLERQGQEMRALLSSDGFRESFPGAYERWADAEALLWAANSERELSTIGHKVREASQHFATALVERYQPPDMNQDVARVKNRLRAVVELHRAKLGSRRSSMLDALIEYWNATVDLIQRQEHAEQRQNEPLTWLDGWRVVLHTGVLMVEIAATLEEVDEPPPVAHLEGGGGRF